MCLSLLHFLVILLSSSPIYTIDSRRARSAQEPAQRQSRVLRRQHIPVIQIFTAATDVLSEPEEFFFRLFLRQAIFLHSSPVACYSSECAV